MLPLNYEQLFQFDREGYLVVEDLFSAEDLQPVIDELSAEIDRRARDLVASGSLTQSFEEKGFETRLASISAETDQLALSIWNGNLAGPAIFDLIRHPKLLDLAEQLCGPELIASAVYRMRPKIPHYDYGAVPWHQDSGYTEPYCDSALILTVWLPLVDANEENGCLWVLPGAHKGPVVRHRTHAARRYLEISPEDLPPGEPVCIPVRKGGVLLMTNRTPHVSYENRTEIVRWSMDLRYQSAALPTNAAISRLAGEAAPSVENSVPPACYPPEADFLVRSQLRPHEIVTDSAVFHAIRKNHLSQPVTNRWG